MSQVNFEMTSQFLSKFCIIPHCMRHYSSVLMLFLFWIKGSHKNPNFETSKCPGENLPDLSCHFPNHKSVFLQISHHSSVSLKITPLYFFRSNIKYFAQQEPIKVQIFETFQVLGSQFTKFLSLLRKLISFSSNIASIFRVMRHNSSTFF